MKKTPRRFLPASKMHFSRKPAIFIDALEPRCFLTIVRPSAVTPIVSAASSHLVVRAVGPAAKLALAGVAGTGTVGTALPSFTVSIEDASGNVVTTDTSAVTIASGASNVSGTLTVTAVNGVATFNNVVPSLPGTYALTASDGVLTSAVSNSITVSSAGVGPAAKLAIVGAPTTGTVGTAFPSFTVRIEDASGNLVTTNSSAVTLSSGSANITGTLTVNAVNGIATFTNVVPALAGTYAITATDGALTTAASNNITVTVATNTPTKLAFLSQLPANGIQSSVIVPPIQVAVENAASGTVTTNTSTVTLAILSGPNGGTLQGTVAQAAVNGVATFSNIAFSLPGTYTLIASDGSLASAVTSSSITITLAAAKLAFAVQPSTVAQGVVIAPPIKVNIEDTTGAVLGSNTSTVALSIASGPAGATIGGTLSVQAVAGVATFSDITLSIKGTYTLLATSGALVSATSVSFVVTGPPSAQLAFIQQPLTGIKNVAITPAITVAVQDADGTQVTTDSSTVTLGIASGPTGAALTGTLSVAAVNGKATFTNVIPTLPGTYQLVARDGTLDTAASFSFTVKPTPAGVPDHLAVTSLLPGQTDPTTLLMLQTFTGSPITPTLVVAVEDAFGKVVTTDNSTVRLVSAQLAGTLAVQAVKGIATFDYAIPLAGGDFTIQITDGSLTATSVTFPVSTTLNPPTHLAFFQAPQSGTARSKFSKDIIVYVEDAGNSIVTSSIATVSLGIADQPSNAILSGVTTVNAVNGVATFSNITPNVAGTFVIQAISGSLTGTEAGNTTVVPPVGDVIASRLQFLARPANTLSGKVIKPAVKVAIRNKLGNLVTNDHSTVRISIRSGPAGGTLLGTVRAVVKNGIASFSSLVLKKKGTYHFVVRDGDLPAVVSAPFKIK